MELTRRTFLSGAVGAGGLLGFLGLDMRPTVAYASKMAQAVKHSRITTTICPYCGVGCGAIVMSEVVDGKRKVINVEGDPDHPINEGTLCPKGASLYQMANGEKRLTKVLYRAPKAKEFVEKSWDWAATEIAKRIKKTRDESFELRNAAGQAVNRTNAIASVGSAALDNEECWLYQLFLRAMGLVQIEHQARI
ncbi:MAG: twin-arginine translocation signal domain-containing protein [Phycisphaerales bacterium]|nr:twin-arginine translocation signal domain-containing protein [Phycisphaerales bacterium]